MKDLYDILKMNSITSGDRFVGMSKNKKRKIYGEIFKCYMSEGPAILDQHKKSSGLKFLFSANKTKYKKLSLLAKKSLLYGQSSIININFPIYSRSINSRNGLGLRYSFPNAKDFVDFILKIKPVVDLGSFHVFPDIIELNESLDRNDISKQPRYFSFTDHELNSIPVCIDRHELAHQLFENSPNVYDDSHINIRQDIINSSKLLLPHLENIPIRIIKKVIMDNPEAFERFQYCLEKFYYAHNAKSENQFLDIMREVDYQVSILNENFIRIKKQRALKNYEIFGGLTSVLICTCISSDVSKYLIPLLGTQSALAGITHIKNKKYEYSKIENSDYFIPYKINQMAKKKKITPKMNRRYKVTW